MNLASIVPYKVLPPVTGGQRAIALFCKYISRHTNYTCITTHSNKAEMAGGFKVVNVFSDSPLRYINPFYFFTLRKLIRENKITHLLLEHPYYGWLGLLLKWFAGVKLVMRSHNIEGLRWKTLGKWWWGILWHYEKWTHSKADYNFFIQDEDRRYALEHYRLKPERCTTVTYGIEWNTPPAAAEKTAARNVLLQRHNIPSNHHLLLFNGSFNYAPNAKGLDEVLLNINPKLQQQTSFQYTIIICGSNIPGEVTGQDFPNVVLAGFVKDIETYYKGCDVFINPITEGGGIKTKLVEALAYNMNAVSSRHGAIGIDPSTCNGKLQIAGDTGYVDNIISLAKYEATIPPAFYEQFYWDSIAAKAAAFLQK